MTKRIVVHDFPGYRFVVQFAAELAQRGYTTTFTYNSNYPGPGMQLSQERWTSSGLKFTGIKSRERRKHSSLVGRMLSERDYTAKLLRSLERDRPEVLFSSNCPSVLQSKISAWCKRNGCTLIPWVQDLYADAAAAILQKKIPVIGSLIGKYFQQLENRTHAHASRIVVISEGFKQKLVRTGISQDRILVVPNWAPIGDIPLESHDNEWSQSQGLAAGRQRFLYSGSLAMKHNPQLLLDLAKRMASLETCPQVVVVSQGQGAEWLREHSGGVTNLKILPFQPDHQYAQVLGSADVLIAVLEPFASECSVPSKILSYLCAGRPILASMPLDNPASQTILGPVAGLVTGPENTDQFLLNAEKLACDESLRKSMGVRARVAAEELFDIRRIVDEFIPLIERR